MKKNRPLILVADDDADDQELLKEAFSKTEPLAEIHSVVFGKDVIQFLDGRGDDQLPALIVIDYNMPDCNGAEVLEKLGGNSRYRNIPAVMWSTSNADLYREMARKNGAREFFYKPHLFEDVVSVTRKMLSLI